MGVWPETRKQRRASIRKVRVEVMAGVLAEACASRTHPRHREGAERRFWRPGGSPDPIRFRVFHPR